VGNFLALRCSAIQSQPACQYAEPRSTAFDFDAAI
jgi:hypothetical protein